MCVCVCVKNTRKVGFKSRIKFRWVGCPFNVIWDEQWKGLWQVGFCKSDLRQKWLKTKMTLDKNDIRQKWL